jgi:4-deoxy-L-threo-5-hexosulose-uronate ketol-isomerase
MSIEIRHAVDPVRYQRMNTKELRESFLVDTLFREDEIKLVYSHVDRAIVGSAVPKTKELKLEADKKEMASDYFTQRREIGVFNIGASGSVKVDNKEFKLNNKECLYIGKGSKNIIFASESEKNPAKFYIISYPAHKDYPTQLARLEDAGKVELGTDDESNRRTIYKYIYPDGIKSCQLVMGFTVLQPGNVWNTMAPHTHVRRSEVYMYFDLEDENVVFHIMGQPSETRLLVVREGQAVISPVWSIHAGAGTRNYSFVWAMGGENQDFDDMDGVSLKNIF